MQLAHQLRLSLGQATGLSQLINARAHPHQFRRLGERQAGWITLFQLNDFVRQRTDYRPQLAAEHKLKKDDGDLPPIALIRNPDILADVAALAKPPLCVGFAAESRDLAAYAEKKRKSKKIPLIVGNLIQDGFGGDDNRLVLFDAHGETPLPPGSKLELSRRLVAHIALMLEKH